MKKILVVAALLATAAVAPATPSFAATVTLTDVPAKCFILALLPECIDAWKAEDAAAKADFDAKMADADMSMPDMTLPPLESPMGSCVAAPAGSGHMYDCTKAE